MVSSARLPIHLQVEVAKLLIIGEAREVKVKVVRLLM